MVRGEGGRVVGAQPRPAPRKHAPRSSAVDTRPRRGAARPRRLRRAAAPGRDHRAARAVRAPQPRASASRSPTACARPSCATTPGVRAATTGGSPSSRRRWPTTRSPAIPALRTQAARRRGGRPPRARRAAARTPRPRPQREPGPPVRPRAPACSSRGATSTGGRSPPAGERLARLYTETDLLLAEAIGEGLLDGLARPSSRRWCRASPTSGVAPTATSRCRRPRWPSKTVAQRSRAIERLARDLNANEDDAGLPETRAPDPGLHARTSHEWAAGETLADVLDDDEMTGGDFVRHVKQCIDLLRQVGDVAPDRRHRAPGTRRPPTPATGAWWRRRASAAAAGGRDGRAKGEPWGRPHRRPARRRRGRRRRGARRRGGRARRRRPRSAGTRDPASDFARAVGIGGPATAGTGCGRPAVRRACGSRRPATPAPRVAVNMVVVGDRARPPAPAHPLAVACRSSSTAGPCTTAPATGCRRRPTGSSSGAPTSSRAATPATAGSRCRCTPCRPAERAAMRAPARRRGRTSRTPASARSAGGGSSVEVAAAACRSRSTAHGRATG